MCSGVARYLKSGGRFVTVNSNPACDFRSAPSDRKYGFETRVAGWFCEGAPITWTFHLEDGPFDIENYFLSVETHQEALRAAGFRGIRWHRPLLSPEGKGAYGRDYWSDLQEPIRSPCRWLDHFDDAPQLAAAHCASPTRQLWFNLASACPAVIEVVSFMR
jgi:hypothetical protein